MKKVTTNITFENGTIIVHNRKIFDELVKAVPNGKGKLTVEKVYNKISNAQYGYYFAVIVPICCMGFRDVGYDFDLDDTHEALRGLFWTTDIVDPKTGEVIGTKTQSTTKMFTIDAMDYFKKIQDFGETYLSVTIPDPDPDHRFNNEKSPAKKAKEKLNQN